MIRQTAQGIWVIDGDSHFTKWTEEAGRLDSDRWLLDKLYRYVRPGDTMLDVGANIGDHTIAYLDWVGSGGKVHAFEPHPLAFECLKRNCPGALCHEFGLSWGTHGAGLNQLDANAGASFVAEEGTWPIRLAALDSIDEIVKRPIHFIKVDIEGHEIDFIDGARETLERWYPVLCMEINPGALERAGFSEAELLDDLRELGYRWEMVQPEKANQYDVIARRD